MLSTSETDEHSITDTALTKIALPYLAWGRAATGTMPGMDGWLLLLPWWVSCRQRTSHGDYCKVQLRVVAWPMGNL